MKKLLIIAALSLISCGEDKKKEEHHHTPVQNENKAASLSPHTSEMEVIGGAHIHIDYSAPSVRDRIIFGGLVGYNTVWQAGAHNATWIETDKDLLINGETLPAGKYGFFVIPGKENWEVIFNSRWEQHGKDDYDEAEDVLRMEVTPDTLSETQEQLRYEIEKKSDKEGVISLAWEKIKIELPFEVQD
ncbi:DUF2911 domain-containing protein [Antarcticibacterium flavum]|uniref:DUF2911 domain-containing protein n=1 Tax=Antarcticibacterium flavum TaxID=2058175 RepID=A0A5B7X1R4_9FLAO|nr:MULTISPECIES: DUF2911 domain-containing protein [Antarcticibacterium]MCM4161020.1 hypothetical protein [Antarcticibacterium sp. W02-3]QCY69259.1 DUF2911 domain-containing protein [Antarcticibacterium flavum]